MCDIYFLLPINKSKGTYDTNYYVSFFYLITL